MKTNYLKIFRIPTIISLVLLVWYKVAESPMERLLVLFTAGCVLIPCVLQLFAFCLKDAVTPSKISNGKTTVTQQKQPQKKYKKKVVNSEAYESLRDTLVILSKNKQLSRDEVINFHTELDELLGLNISNYERFQFKNDFHAIYTKLKSSKLTDRDYLYLLDMLTTSKQVKE